MAATKSFEEQLAQWDAARWSVACREMEVRIMNGHYEAAHRCLSRFLSENKPGYANVDSFLSQVLPIRIASALEGAGYVTVLSVDAASNDDLMKIPNFGFKALQQVRDVVAKCKAGQLLDIHPDENLEELIDPDYFSECSKPGGDVTVPRGTLQTKRGKK